MDNLESYSNEATVSYYQELGAFGLFTYEKKIIDKYFKSGSLVLDIGCGTGRTTIPLKERGYKVIGIDYSSEMIKKARKNAQDIEFSVQNAKKMSFEDNSFDCALFSFNGLMLMPSYDERLSVIQEVSRVLKKRGVFFFTTPFLDNKIYSDYWSQKIKTYSSDLTNMKEEERMEIGDEITSEGDTEFFIHVPLLDEVRASLSKCGFDIIYSCRRLDVFEEEKVEDELDDNYIWVAING